VEVYLPWQLWVICQVCHTMVPLVLVFHLKKSDFVFGVLFWICSKCGLGPIEIEKGRFIPFFEMMLL